MFQSIHNRVLSISGMSKDVSRVNNNHNSLPGQTHHFTGSVPHSILASQRRWDTTRPSSTSHSLFHRPRTSTPSRRWKGSKTRSIGQQHWHGFVRHSLPKQGTSTWALWFLGAASKLGQQKWSRVQQNGPEGGHRGSMSLYNVAGRSSQLTSGRRVSPSVRGFLDFSIWRMLLPLCIKMGRRPTTVCTAFSCQEKSLEAMSLLPTLTTSRTKWSSMPCLV